jgi:hypothetical protein
MSAVAAEASPSAMNMLAINVIVTGIYDESWLLEIEAIAVD